VFCGLKFNRRD